MLWNFPFRETIGAVAFVRRDAELSHLADFHAEAALVPASDDLANARLVAERLLASVLGGPELVAALLDDAGGVDGHLASFGNRTPSALSEHFVRGGVASDRIRER